MSDILNLLLGFGAIFFVVLVLMMIYIKSAKRSLEKSSGERRSGDNYGKGAPSN